jgi:dihydrofolate reductase
MNEVILDISMPLDGLMTAADRVWTNRWETLARACTHGAFGGDAHDRQILADVVHGAMIAGRRTYAPSAPSSGPDAPTGPARVPVSVITHGVSDGSPTGGVDTIDAAATEQTLEQATRAAGSSAVTVMGGAQTGHQYHRAGLTDELRRAVGHCHVGRHSRARHFRVSAIRESGPSHPRSTPRST